VSWFGAKNAQFKAGFRDVRWGDPPVQGMAVLKQDGHECLYMRSSDSLRLGDGRLTGINYKFWRGKLHGVVLQIAPGSLRDAMNAVQKVYGKPTQPNPLKQRYYWMSLGEGADTTQAMFDVEPTRQSGTLIIFSKVLVDRRKAEEGEAPSA